MQEKFNTDEIVQANIEVHSKMVDEYNNEPHFRPENQEKVSRVLSELKQKYGGTKLLDIGCGTGFIINLAKHIFDEIHGIDVTQPMLDKIDINQGNIHLQNCRAEKMPFEDASFDIVTSYAFIHHVASYEAVLKEAYRVLVPGGVLYVDLEPNKAFWIAIEKLDKEKSFSGIVDREIQSVLSTDLEVSKKFGIEPDTFNLAEYTKSILGGIDPDEFEATARNIGFTSCETYHEWFLGQGDVMHNQSFEAAEIVSAYLNRTLPLSSHLFKYLRFILIK